MSTGHGCCAFDVLAWAVSAGAALALCDEPGDPPGVGADGLAVIAPHLLGAPQPLAVPDAVRAALAADWEALRDALAATHAALGRRGLPGWPDSLEGVSGATLLTMATWAESVRLTFDADDQSAWSGIAAHAVTTGLPRWIAAVAAVEVLALSPDTLRPGVRARHLAAIRSAIGA